MIAKIVTHLKQAKEIVVAAQHLINEQYDATAETVMAGSQRDGSFANKLSTLRKAVKKSMLLTAGEKRTFAEMSEAAAYETARNIVITLLRQEIKTPL